MVLFLKVYQQKGDWIFILRLVTLSFCLLSLSFLFVEDFGQASAARLNIHKHTKLSQTFDPPLNAGSPINLLVKSRKQLKYQYSRQLSSLNRYTYLFIYVWYYLSNSTKRSANSETTYCVIKESRFISVLISTFPEHSIERLYFPISSTDVVREKRLEEEMIWFLQMSELTSSDPSSRVLINPGQPLNVKPHM